jgi:hypothetical protein
MEHLFKSFVMQRSGVTETPRMLRHATFICVAAVTGYGLVACTSDATTQPRVSLGVATAETTGSIAPPAVKPLNNTCDYYPELNLTVCCPPTLVRAGVDSGDKPPFVFLGPAMGCTYSPGPQNPSAPPVGYEPYVPLPPEPPAPPETPETPPNSPGPYNPPPQDYGGGGNNPEGNGPGNGGAGPGTGGGNGDGCTQVRSGTTGAMSTFGTPCQHPPEWWEGPSDPSAYDNYLPGLPRLERPNNLPEFPAIDCRIVKCPPVNAYLESPDVRSAANYMQALTKQTGNEYCAWLFLRANGSIRVGDVMQGSPSNCAGVQTSIPGNMPPLAIGSLHSHPGNSPFASGDDYRNAQWGHINMIISTPSILIPIDTNGTVLGYIPRRD